jgi:putative copper export protein
MQTAGYTLIEWPKPFWEYLSFAAQYLAAGAIGFRYSALRGAALATPEAPHEAEFHEQAARRAAMLGLCGAVVSALLVAKDLPESAARAHKTISELLATNFLTGTQAALVIFAVVGLAVAASGRRIGWPIAVLGVVVRPLRALLLGQWTRIVNPVHVLAGGLWIGTLLMLVLFGIVPLLRRAELRDRRGAIVTRMVNDFSPLALFSASVLVIFGVITAWRHLKYLSALWTTPYGQTLIGKLCLVAVVVSLGAWNWKRQRPQLGTDAAAISLKRSATAELIVAALVIAFSAILVSLPTPKAP